MGVIRGTKTKLLKVKVIFQKINCLKFVKSNLAEIRLLIANKIHYDKKYEFTFQHSFARWTF
jgi:hypothetical protein